MTHDPQASIPRFQASQFGAVYFEGEYIPCAFGGDPGHFTAFVVIEGVCRMIGISYETELARIKEHHLLNDGLFRVPFNTVSSAGKLETTEYPAITLTRLHTWLALIPPELCPRWRYAPQTRDGAEGINRCAVCLFRPSPAPGRYAGRR